MQLVATQDLVDGGPGTAGEGGEAVRPQLALPAQLQDLGFGLVAEAPGAPMGIKLR
jgi:hypothetical protein